MAASLWATSGLILRLPGTPLRASRQDRLFARLLHVQRVPLRVVYAAFVLAIARREIRSASLPRLPAIRTLRFFQGAIDEVLQAGIDTAYVVRDDGVDVGLPGPEQAHGFFLRRAAASLRLSCTR